jgi:hypothetical protein
MSDILFLLLARVIIPPSHLLEMAGAVQTDEFRVAQQGDIRGLLNAADKVSRHRVSETGASDKQLQVFCVFSQEHSGLASRVSTSHHDHFLATAELCLNGSRP